MSEESKLAEQIRSQAKAIADEQLKQQQQDQASGKLKISSAAAALNNAEMGLDDAPVGEAEQNKNEIVSISSDQMYVTDKKDGSDDSKQKQSAIDQQSSSSTEAAAITMAKKAAKTAITFENEKQSSKAGAKDLQSPKDKPTVKTQALAQSSTTTSRSRQQATGKQDRRTAEGASELNQKGGRKGEDLIHRIDKQLMRIKQNNKNK